MRTAIEKIDWGLVKSGLNEWGYVIIPQLLGHQMCDDLIELYDNHDNFRKTVSMERHRFGEGEYKYFGYPLPEPVNVLRESLYSGLAPIANEWMGLLKEDRLFPKALSGLKQLCHKNGQDKATPLILKYAKDGFNTLHQDLYGEVYFPLQAALFLNQYNEDYNGGEFVMTQQTPRAQSKAMVINPNKGDVLLFTTNYRPVKGKRGYYRVKMRHGVSVLQEGVRHTLGIIFHDSKN